MVRPALHGDHADLHVVDANELVATRAAVPAARDSSIVDWYCQTEPGIR